MILIYISCILSSSTGLRFNILTKEVKDAKSSYITKSNRRIKKNSLMKADTNLATGMGELIMFHTHCLPEDTDKAKKILLNKISSEYNKMKEKMDILTKAYEQSYNDNINCIQTKKQKNEEY